MIHLIILLAPTTIPAAAFSPNTLYIMTKAPPARRTSSIAYDDKSHGPKYAFCGGDSWRGRVDSSLLSSSESSLDENAVYDKPMFSFGILTDIQYAPVDDGHSFNGTPRYYRHAKTAAGHAARHFEEEKVQCVLNLGDIIDGKCLHAVNGHRAVDDVLEALSVYKHGRIVHTYGNHELYNLSRQELGKKLQIPFTVESTGDLVGYYGHEIERQNHPESDDANNAISSNNDKLRFLVLDSYDICVLDRCPKESNKHRRARETLSANNPNYPHQENSPEGLEGLSKRFVAFGGGIDTPQLQWFEDSLQSARMNNERVIIVSHQPIHPESSWPTCLMWNYSDILDVMRRYRDVIIASFSGHAHKGGYVRDAESGIHFRALEAVLESPDPIRTYGIVNVYRDRLVFTGSGHCVSDIYDLDHLTIDDQIIVQTLQEQLKLDERFEIM